jgi:5-oxopent-3-ene-1,2,5-tricarboxylate decarboxylase / 2-hydroxyhepta-2,4-diene-1,7-dioate isomerase
MSGSCNCWQVKGTVYGVALDADDPCGPSSDLFTQPPYHRAPTAPVLFIKPRNTFLPPGGTVLVPSSLQELEATAVVGLVFGRDTRAVSSTRALDAVSGYTLAIDLSEPPRNYFRPPIREKCRDGFLPIGPSIVSRDAIANLESLVIGLEVDGKETASFALTGGVARIARLIEHVSGFMTLRAGDVLLAFRTPVGSRARVGSRVSAVAEGLERLDCLLRVEEEGAS